MPPCFKLPIDDPLGTWGPNTPGAALVTWIKERILAGDTPPTLSLKIQGKHGKAGLLALELALGALRLARARQEEHTIPALPFVHREAWEQSSKPPLSRYHASLFQGCHRVLEVGTGLGLDTIALAEIATEVVTLEPDPIKAAFARANFDALGLGRKISVVEQRFEDALVIAQQCDGIFFDPSRRLSTGERVHDPLAYSPALDVCLQNIAPHQVVALKLSPLAFSVSPPPGRFRRELLGVEQEVRELLWVTTPSASQAGGTTCGPSDCSLVVTLKLLSSNGACSNLALPDVSSSTPLERIAPESLKCLYDFHPLLHALPGAARWFASQNALGLVSTEHGYFGSARSGSMPADRSIPPWAKGFRIIDRCALKAEQIQRIVDTYKLPSTTPIRKREAKLSTDALHSSLQWHVATPPQPSSQLLMLVDSKPKGWCFLVEPLKE